MTRRSLSCGFCCFPVQAQVKDNRNNRGQQHNGETEGVHVPVEPEIDFPWYQGFKMPGLIHQVLGDSVYCIAQEIKRQGQDREMPGPLFQPEAGADKKDEHNQRRQHLIHMHKEENEAVQASELKKETNGA